MRLSETIRQIAIGAAWQAVIFGVVLVAAIIGQGN